MGTLEPLDLTARLTAVHCELARAHDAKSFLLAIAGALAPLGPRNIDLAYVHVGADGEPELFEGIASWEDGALLSSSPAIGVRFAVADLPLAQLMLRSRDAPQLFADVGAAPLLAEIMTALDRTPASAAILPLFSDRQGTWQGAVGVYWSTPHAVDADERALLVLLMHMFAEALASKRTQRALRDSLLRNEALLRGTQATLRESEAQKATLQALLDNLPLGVAVINGATGRRELMNRRGQTLLGEHGEESAEMGATQPYAYAPGEATPIAPERLPHVRTLATGETYSAELEFEVRAGQRALLDVTTSQVRYPGDAQARVILLYQDITDERRREHERLRAQEELLQAQDELLRAQELALVERSTPLIPIRDDVMVMPIIGTIDARRGRQILETLVHLGGASHVRAVIIDVTGVRELDTEAANTLVSAAQALRLRGVQPILSGIQPVVAATLVHLGVELRGIHVSSNLQSAVAHASPAHAAQAAHAPERAPPRP